MILLIYSNEYLYVLYDAVLTLSALLNSQVSFSFSVVFLFPLSFFLFPLSVFLSFFLSFFLLIFAASVSPSVLGFSACSRGSTDRLINC